MIRLTGWVALLLVIAWVLAHLLYLGPIRDVTETTLAWMFWLGGICGVVAALAVLAFGLAAGSGSPVWLRFVAWSRTGAAVVGCALVVVGLLHYRDTEPQGEIRWIILGLVVLAGACIVHWWVVRTQRRVF
jgi:hypothetical protein